MGLATNWSTLLSVGLGGAVGAVLRFVLSGVIQAGSGGWFPLGTLVVNVAGSLLMGLVLQASMDRSLFPDAIRLLITTGFCGALTTYSTFSFETLALIHSAHWVTAATNILLNVLLTLAAVALGIWLARLI